MTVGSSWALVYIFTPTIMPTAVVCEKWMDATYYTRQSQTKLDKAEVPPIRKENGAR